MSLREGSRGNELLLSLAFCCVMTWSSADRRFDEKWNLLGKLVTVFLEVPSDKMVGRI